MGVALTTDALSATTRLFGSGVDRCSLRGAMHRTGPRLAALTFVLAGACGGEDIPPTCLETITCALQIESGADQSIRVGLPFQQMLSVRVLDAYLLPAAAIDVAWRAVQGGGAVSANSVPTTADGISSVSVTAGSVAGPQIFEAALSTGASVSFALVADADVPSELAITAGETQTGAAGAPLPMPLQV
ncbi:MAG: hypothetical protein AAFU79_26655, partial [Myxococcota bacterium]